MTREVIVRADARVEMIYITSGSTIKTLLKPRASVQFLLKLCEGSIMALLWRC
jgi:hypothetical protein